MSWAYGLYGGGKNSIQNFGGETFRKHSHEKPTRREKDNIGLLLE
jgi:hypothetical protein